MQRAHTNGEVIDQMEQGMAGGDERWAESEMSSSVWI